LLCRRLIEQWMSEPSGEELQDLYQQVHREATSRGLEERSLSLVLQAGVNAATGERPDAFIPQVLARAATAAESTRESLMLQHVDAAFESTTDRPGDAPTASAPLGTVVRNEAESHGTDTGRALVAWLVRLIEQPGKRFKAAERAAAFLTRNIETLSKTARGRVGRVRGQRQTLRQQIEARGALAGAKPKQGSGDAAPRGGLRTGRELEGYCRLWLREIAEENILVLLNAVQRVIDAFLHELSLGSRQLKALADRFHLPASSKGTASGGWKSTKDTSGQTSGTAQVSDVTLPPGLVQFFDKSLQGPELEKMSGLWGLMSGADDPFNRAAERSRPSPEQFAENLLVRARVAIQGSASELNTAQSFLRTHGGPEKCQPVLLAHAEAAQPRLLVPGCAFHLVAALPNGPSGETVNELLAAALPRTSGSLVRTDDDVMLCYETSGCSLPGVAHMLIGQSHIPDELVRLVITRLDASRPVTQPPTIDEPAARTVVDR
jgi:hypothetical protein